MTSTTSRAIFAESGHFTAMHNALFDWVQPRLSLSAWSVLCVIVRRTRGWGKKYDAISYEQIKAATGIKSTATVAKALNELLSEIPFGKPILRRQKSRERVASCREATRYALNPRFEIECGEDFSQRREDAKERESGSFRDCGASVFEGPDGARALESDGPEPVRASENEDTKESPLSYEVENWKCENARASPLLSTPSPSSPFPSTPSPSPSAPSTFRDASSPALLVPVCAATLRDAAIVSSKMRGQLVSCARTLERAGYGAADIELATKRWPYPTAPTPSQLLDNIGALLGARCEAGSDADFAFPPTFTSASTSTPTRAKPSIPAARSLRAGNRGANDGPTRSDRSGPTPTRPRFECAAERKSRKWADWLAELGDS